jgi:hypothetical protein
MTFRKLRFENTKITDPERSSLSLVCGYNDQGWYKIDFDGGVYKIISRIGYQQRSNVPPNSGLKEWKYGEDVNKVNVICKSDEISIALNNGNPYIYRLGVDEVKLSERQLGITLTTEKDFPVKVQILSARVSER